MEQLPSGEPSRELFVPLEIRESNSDQLTPAQVRALQHFLRNNPEANKWLDIEERREQVLGIEAAEKGLDIVVWSHQSPGSGRQFIGRTLPLFVVAGLAYLTVQETQAASEFARMNIPPALNGFLEAMITPNFHLTDPNHLRPAFDFSNFNLLDRRFDIRVNLPTPGAAFDPVIAEHQARVNAALEVVKQKSSQTALQALKPFALAIGTIGAAIKYHPFREIRENNIFFSKAIGWTLYRMNK